MALDIEKGIKLITNEIDVVLTRRTDVFIPLVERARIANRAKADSFYSLHFNSAGVDTAKGAETFHYKGSKSGRQLAESIQVPIVKSGLPLADRGVKEAGFAVLKHTAMKASLFENCFINNKTDINKFIDNYEEYIKIIVDAILKEHNVKPNKPEHKEPDNTVTDKIEDIITKPDARPIEIVKNKMNIDFIGEHIAVEGFIKDGRSFITVNGLHLEFREIFENMDLKVGWNNEARIITVDTSGKYLQVEGTQKVNILGNLINVQTFIYNDKHCLRLLKTYVPIRDIFETMGYDVGMKDDIIYIEKPYWSK